MEIIAGLVGNGIRGAEDDPLVVLIGLVVLLPDDEDGSHNEQKQKRHLPK